MRTIKLSASTMVKGPSLHQGKKKADFTHAANELLVLRKQVENPNSYILKHLGFRQRPTEEREKWNSNGNDGDGTIGLNFSFLFNLVDATRMSRMIYFLSRCRKNHSDFVQGSRLQAMAIREV